VVCDVGRIIGEVGAEGKREDGHRLYTQVGSGRVGRQGGRAYDVIAGPDDLLLGLP